MAIPFYLQEARNNRRMADETLDRMQFRRGHSMTNEDSARRRSDILSRMDRRERQAEAMKQERDLLQMEQTGQTRRQELVANADRDVAGINRDSAVRQAELNSQAEVDVAETRAGADRDVANTRAGADRFTSLVDSIGGVIGNWLTQGAERLRQQGDTDRLQRLLDASGPKEGGMYQDATGRASAMPTTTQPGARPVYDQETGDLIGREVILSDGKPRFERLPKEAGPGDGSGNPFDPGTPEYEAYRATGGQAAKGSAATRAPVGNLPLPNMQPVKGRENDFTWMDGGGNRRELKRTPEGWQIKTQNGWRFIVTGS